MLARIYFERKQVWLINKRLDPEPHDYTGAIDKLLAIPVRGTPYFFNISSIDLTCNSTSNTSGALQLLAET